MKRALLIDAYDSFVHVIRQYLISCSVDTTTTRNDRLDISEIGNAAYDFIVLGPGPGHPVDAGYVEIVKRYGRKIPILGVCLGHQAIGLAFGGTIRQASHLMHGKVSRIAHCDDGVFRGMKQGFLATRYHSLIVDSDDLPPDLETTARSMDDGYVMGLRHRSYPIEGVQFHPESITTESGMSIFHNFIHHHI